VEDPTTIGSWTQRFALVSLREFDTLVVHTGTSGVELRAGGNEGLGNFWSIEQLFWPDDAGWSGTLVTPKTARATGRAVHDLLFNIYFSSDISDPLSFTFAASYRGAPRVSGTAYWSGQNMNDTAIGFWSIGQATSVPEPSTLLLRSAWVLGLGLLIARRRNSLRM